MGDLPAEPAVPPDCGTCIIEDATGFIQARRNELKEMRTIPGLQNQLYAALALSVATFLSGIVEGWPGSMSLKLTDPDTSSLFQKNNHSSGPPCIIGSKDISRIYVYMLLAALVHMMITGALMDRFGRKAGFFFFNFMAPSGWVYLATASNISQLHVGAGLIGSVGVSGEAIGVVYISEIANDQVRGPLISLLMYFNSLGVLIAHVFGEELPFYVFHYLCLLVTLLFPLFMWFLPESPQYLVLKSREREARESVAWFHGNNPAIVESEMKKLQNAKKLDIQECKTMLSSSSNRKAILIVCGLSVLTEMVGTSMIEVFAGPTLAQLDHAKLTPKIASIVLAFCRFLGGILNVYFIEKAGRKSMLSASLVKMGFCLVFLFIFFKNDVDNFQKMHNFPHPPDGSPTTFYLATTCLVLYTLSNQMFLGTTEVLSGEILSADTKGAMFAVGGFARISTLVLCVALYNYTLNSDALGTWNVFFNFLCCFFGAYLTLRFIPETRGKTLNEIHRELEVNDCFVHSVHTD